MESSQLQNSRRSHCRKRIYFDVALHLVHKLIPMPLAMKISGAQAAVVKECKKLETVRKCDSGSTKIQKESPLCFTDGHVSPRKRGVGNEATEVQRQSCALEGQCDG